MSEKKKLFECFSKNKFFRVSIYGSKNFSPLPQSFNP